MGQKVNPRVFRLSSIGTWNSRWFSKRAFGILLKEDASIKKFLRHELKNSSVSKIEIERFANAIKVIVHTSKPGLIIGRSGVGVEDLKKKIKQKFFGSQKIDINLSVEEVGKPNLEAELIVQSIAADLEKRMPYRRIMKQSIGRVEKAGAQGVKIQLAGRLNGAEIARTETLSSGKVPLHTLRADIDYSRAAAHTVYGQIGIKVWIYRGEIFDKPAQEAGQSA